MIMGHYATALLPRARNVRVPFWTLLLLANLPDFVWIALAAVGIEPTTPESFLDVTFRNIDAHMGFSHNMFYVVIATVVIGGSVFAVSRHLETALWCGALVLAHLLCDYLSGFEHLLAFEGSPNVGLNLYKTAPVLAVFVEALFAAACVLVFVGLRKRSGKPVSTKGQLSLYGAFAGGTLFFLPTAVHSLREWFAG